MKRRVSKRENGDGNIGGDESTDTEVSLSMASRTNKCSHCFVTCTTVDGHLLTHQTEQVKLHRTSKISGTKERKTKGKTLPTCKLIITRCDNLCSLYNSIGTVHTLATKIQQRAAIAEKTLPRKTGLELARANSLIKKACPRKHSLKETSDRGITTDVGIKSYECQLCSKSFGHQGNLKRHILTHTGERAHRCRLCSKSFTRQDSLQNHIRTHTGERPNRCRLCSKSFANLGHLKRHIRTHTGERPHRCQLCLKSFGELSTLKSHIRTHTGEQSHK